MESKPGAAAFYIPSATFLMPFLWGKRKEGGKQIWEMVFPFPPLKLLPPPLGFKRCCLVELLRGEERLGRNPLEREAASEA